MVLIRVYDRQCIIDILFITLKKNDFEQIARQTNAIIWVSSFCSINLTPKQNILMGQQVSNSSSSLQVKHNLHQPGYFSVSILGGTLIHTRRGNSARLIMFSPCVDWVRTQSTTGIWDTYKLTTKDSNRDVPELLPMIRKVAKSEPQAYSVPHFYQSPG